MTSSLPVSLPATLPASLTSSPPSLVAVLGATGKTGRRVAHRLAASGVPVRAGSRRADPPFDWTNRAGWPDVVRGASAVYLSYVPDLAVPGAVDDVAAFCEIAVDAGVRRIVALSGRGEEGAAQAESVIRAGVLEWTIVRASWFAQNFSEGYLLDAVRSGFVSLPADLVREPFVDVEDIADIAAAAILLDDHVGQIYEVSGPRALTFAEAVNEIADAAGIAVNYQPISLAEFADGLAAEGVSAPEADLLTYLFREVLDGRNERPVDGVERALGRPATDFSAFARTAAAAGEWSAADASGERRWTA